ncbi:MAG: alpha/beta hydrolase [Sphingobacterium sp.]|jgi:pimeloyl-ACP methyl ester carboxylesterase|nr:alpha/beta hydrolase [Sphingobacterium sp.]
MKTKNTLGLIIAVAIALFLSCQQEIKTKSDSSKDVPNTKTIKKPSETGYVNLNGLKMYYEVYGKGKPIVLLHGSYMTIPLNWSDIIPMFNGRKVIVAEMQGHGRTRDTARKISYEGMADDVSGLLKHLKIDSADILGYSMGGGIAFQLAIRHPEQVRRLIVLSGSYAHDGWWPEVEASYSSINAEMFKDSPIEKQYESLGNDPKHFPEFVKKVISIDLEPYDWSKEVKKIKAPIFMAIGDSDGIQYEHALTLFRAMGGGKMGDIHGLPKSRLAIIPGTTHIGMMYRMDWLVPMIDDFLNSDLKTSAPTF